MPSAISASAFGASSTAKPITNGIASADAEAPPFPCACSTISAVTLALEAWLSPFAGVAPFADEPGSGTIRVGTPGDLMIFVSTPRTVSCPRSLTATIAILPGDKRSRAPPSRVETSTRPSTTCTDAPDASTVTLNVVPFTTAARYGVFTPKCGLVFFVTLKTTLPSRSKN